MRKTLTSRIDDKTAEKLKKLAKNLNVSESEIVRRSIELMSAVTPVYDSPKCLVGLGMFESGITDLGSNKKHLEGFGK